MSFQILFAFCDLKTKKTRVRDIRGILPVGGVSASPDSSRNFRKSSPSQVAPGCHAPLVSSVGHPSKNHPRVTVIFITVSAGEDDQPDSCAGGWGTLGGKSGGSIVLLGAQRQEKRDDVLVIKASSDSAVLALIVPHLWAPNRHWPQAREGVLLREFYFHFFSSVCKAEPLWTLRAFSGTTVWGRAEHAVEHCYPGIMIPHQQGKPQALLWPSRFLFPLS